MRMCFMNVASRYLKMESYLCPILSELNFSKKKKTHKSICNPMHSKQQTMPSAIIYPTMDLLLQAFYSVSIIYTFIIK